MDHDTVRSIIWSLGSVPSSFQGSAPIYKRLGASDNLIFTLFTLIKFESVE
jgi:hypothetical protein